MQMNGNAEMLTVRGPLEALVRSAVDFPRSQQLRPEPGLVGNARRGWLIQNLPPSQALPPFNYAAYAAIIGAARRRRMERPEDVGPGWDAALTGDRPVIVDAVVDPNVTQLPAHITFEQAHNLLSSLVKGDPDRTNVVQQTVRSVLASFSPANKA